jgi:myosin regulatory light chain 12
MLNCEILHSALQRMAFCILEYSIYKFLFAISFVFSGKNPTDDYLEAMMNEAPGPINFTMFLTLFGERLQGTDPEDVIKNAFGCFDEENKGVINEERLRELLTSMGDRFTDEEVRYMLQ